MKALSWLPTCATATQDPKVQSLSAANGAPSLNPLVSDASSASDDTSGTAMSEASSVSLQSNLSLQTLPTVPSLQKLTSDDPLNLSVSYVCLHSFKPQQKLPITSLTLHDGAIYAASSHEVNVYDCTTYNRLSFFNNQGLTTGSVKSMSFCGGKMFTAHQDCKIRVWEITPFKQHKYLTSLPTIKDRLRHFLLPKSYIHLRRHRKVLWVEHADAITNLAVNNGLIYSVSWDRCLKIWGAKDLRCLESIKAHDDAVNAVAVSDDGKVYTGSSDGKIRVWTKPVNERKHVLLATLERHKSAVNALALNDNNGSVLFSGACDRSILVWEREDSASHMVVTGALRGHKKAILCLINVSGFLLSGSADRTVRVWRRGVDGKYCCLAVLEGHRKPVKSVAGVLEDGNGTVSVFSGCLDGEIKVWQVSVLRSCHSHVLNLDF